MWWLATESIYQALYRHQTGLLRRAKTPDVVSPLRTVATIGAGTRASCAPAGGSLSRCCRSTTAASSQTDRSAAGHWEGYLIVGPHHLSAIAIFIERQTRYVKVVHLPAPDSATLRTAW